MPNMSQATRRQLYGCDMIFAALSAFDEAMSSRDETPSREIVSVMFRLRRGAEKAERMAGRVYDANGQWQLERPQLRAYESGIRELQQAIHTQFGEHLDARAYLSSVQVWVEKMRWEIPAKDVNKRMAWAELLQNTQQLLDLCEDDGRMWDMADKGEIVGMQMIQTSGAWA